MKRRREESGFALLLVFVLAAVIAIAMYSEMPRVAFESQRAKEQMAVDRGLQYQRAIQLFYRKFRTYPTTLEDLETARNIRFLRRRYKDPLTGKDWRLVHVGPGGILTDSNIKQTAQANAGANQPGASGSQPGASGSQPGSSQPGSSQPGGTQASNDTSAGNGQTDSNGQPLNPGLNMAARRPSDRVIGGGPEQPPSDDPNQQNQNPQQYSSYPQQPGQQQYQYPGQPVQPGQDPSLTGQQPQPYPGQVPSPAVPGVPQLPGQLGQMQNPPQPGQPQDPSQPQQPGQPQQPVQPQYPGQPAGYPPPPIGVPGIGGQPFTPFGQNPNQPGQPTAINAQTGGITGTGQQPNQAVNMIQQLLTTPRQPPSSVTGSVTTGGVGIAGVGGTADGKGIHVIKDHSKYKEWEFIYDIKNDKTVVGAAAAAQQPQLPTTPTGLQQTPTTTSTPAPTSPTPSTPAPPTSN